MRGRRHTFTCLLVLLGAPSPVQAQAPPEFTPQPADRATVEMPEMPTVDDPMLVDVRPPPHVLRSWREAIRLVRNRSTAYRISLAQVAQAQGQARQALAAALPQVTGSANLTRHLLFGRGVNFGSEGVQQNAIIPDPATIFSASIDVRQPLLALGTWYQIGTAKRLAKAAELNQKDTERLLLAAVADSALGVVTAERVADVSKVSLRSALSTLDLTKRRALLGAASAVDVLRAEQEVALTRAQVVSANEAVHQAREALGRALGDDDAWGVTPDVRLDELIATARAICQPVQNVEARSDIQAAALNVEIAERNAEGIDYRYAPTVDLTSSLSFLSNRNRSPNGEFMTWTVGALLTWPIYDGGERYGGRLTAEAESVIAHEQLEETKRTARIEVQQALRGVEVAQANRLVSLKSREIAQESARLAKIAFVNGTGTSFDLIDSARRLREAEIDLAIQDFDLVQAQIAAFLAQANCGI